MNGIKKVFRILPSKLNKYMYVFIILLLISSFFELLSISVLIPIVEIIINGNTSIDFINSKLINYQKEFSLNQILISSLFLIILIFFYKNFIFNFFFILDKQIFTKYL